MSVVSFERRGHTAVLTVNNPPVNALSQPVRAGLLDAVMEARKAPDIVDIIICAAGRTFIAGADIREFGKPMQPPSLREVLDAIDQSDKPVIAVMHGTALGGGLELALACRHRIAASGTKLGLPEVKLGILPGAGGTQRLPRLVGAKKALDMMLSGEPVQAEEAVETGLIDIIVPGPLLDEAMIAARSFKGNIESVRLRSCSAPVGLFGDTRKRIARTAANLLAPFRIVDCVEAACTKGFDEAMAFERQALTECLDSPQRAAQVHVFFAERAAAKVPGIEGVTPATVNKALVLGAGTMGSGIAMCFANGGIPVHLVDLSPEALLRGRATIEGNYASSVKRASITQQQADGALARITYGEDLERGSDADIAIEAVFEDLEIKKEVMAKLDAVMKSDAIVATNTSTLDIDAMAKATKRPSTVVGTHFFSPANVMKLLEVVRGTQTSPQTIATTMALGRRLGKISILAGNCDGFIANRMHMPLGNEVDRLIEEGAAPAQIDRVMREFGLAMGPVAVRDLVGIDTAFRLRDQRRKLHPGKQPPTPLIDRLFAMGRLGQKVGKGYYRYEERKALPDPEVDALIEEIAREQGVIRKPISDNEVRDRLLLGMVNEATRILDEGIAQRVSDVDLAYVYGYGFPAWRGGPMFWAQSAGLKDVVARLHSLAERLGPSWLPSTYLEMSAASGKWPHD